MARYDPQDPEYRARVYTAKAVSGLVLCAALAILAALYHDEWALVAFVGGWALYDAVLAVYNIWKVASEL